MPNDNQQQKPLTPGTRKILNTIKDELFPQIEILKNLLVEFQQCRISYQLYSLKLHSLEIQYSTVAENFFKVVKKLETPNILFENVEGGEKNMIDYFQWQGVFKDNIKEGVEYIEIIDRTLDRKMGAIQNNRTFLISVIALVISILAFR
jgi:hypothetical protein